MTLALYKIAAAIEQAVEFDDETGEISPESEARLAALEIARDEKACDIACLVLALDAEESAIRVEARKLQARAQSIAHRSEWLRSYLAQWLSPSEKIKDARVSISVGFSDSVEITGDLPLEFMAPQPAKPDKTAIKDAIKQGVAVPGAKLTTKQHVTIR